jgi:Gamma tubulin complex component N-terminal
LFLCLPFAPLQSFVAAIQRELASYYRLIAVLQSQLDGRCLRLSGVFHTVIVCVSCCVHLACFMIALQDATLLTHCLSSLARTPLMHRGHTRLLFPSTLLVCGVCMCMCMCMWCVFIWAYVVIPCPRSLPSVVPPGKGNELTLRRLLVWVQQPLVRMKVLAMLIHAVRGKKGGHLASAVDEHRLHGSPPVRALVTEILNSVSEPLFAMFARWMFRVCVYEEEFCVVYSWGARHSHALVHTHTHTHTRIHTHIYAHTHTHMHIHTRARTHALKIHHIHT